MADETQLDTATEKADNFPVVLPMVYFNGFEVGISLSDLYVTLMTNGHQHSQLFMSFGTAKTLLVHLKRTVDEFERRTNQPIMAMEDVKQALGQANTSTPK